jgi:hypothetical protein
VSPSGSATATSPGVPPASSSAPAGGR